MFLFKKYLVCTQQYILYQLYRRTSCMKITVEQVAVVHLPH